MWRSWGQKCLWLISFVKPLPCFSLPGAKQVRSEEFNMTFFSSGSLWSGCLYQRLAADGASWWRTHTVLECLVWSDWIKALAFPYRGFSAEAWSISASLSRKIKGRELELVSARLIEVLGPSLSQDERSQCRGRGPLLQAMLSWQSSFVTSCGNKGLLRMVASWQSAYRALCTWNRRWKAWAQYLLLFLFSARTQFSCGETDTKSACRVRHGAQTFNRRPQSPLWPQHGQRSHCCLCQIWLNFLLTDFQNGLILIISLY